jgi:hypothetical protein
LFFRIFPSSEFRVKPACKFNRYEYLFLNSIYYFLDKSLPNITKETNTANKDKTRYDLLISDGKTEKDAKVVLLVEIDEAQHFKKIGFIDGQLREDIFKDKYGKSKKFILRIRVSEDGKLDDGKDCKSCVEKTKNLIKIIDKKRYEMNMESTKDYISSVFSKNKPKNTQ